MTTAPELNFASVFVGREAEMATVEKWLSEAAAGRGSIGFIAGEAGIGKSSFAGAVEKRAGEIGFRVLSATCTQASAAQPYQAVLSALAGEGGELPLPSGGRVEEVFLLGTDGTVVQHYAPAGKGGASAWGGEALSGLVMTVQDFVRDSFKSEGGLKELEYGRHTIVIEHGKEAVLAALLPKGGGIRMGLLRQDMADALARAGGGDREAPAGLLLKEFGLPAPTDLRRERERITEGTLNALLALAEERPIMLLLDGLHWADEGTLQILLPVARSARRARILVMGTYRHEEVEGRADHPLARALQELAEGGLEQRITLPRLTEAEVGAFIGALMPKALLGEGFTADLFRESEGNPLYLTELLRLMIDEGNLLWEGRWRLVKPVGDLDVPKKVVDVVRRRIQRVPEELREVMEFSSVLGDEFTSALLGKCLEKERLKLLKALRALEKTHSLIVSKGPAYRFTSSKVREVVYLEVPEELRQEYHLVAGNAIEAEKRSDAERDVHALALHFYHGMESEKSVKYGLLAGDRAMRSYMPMQARDCYERAVERLGDMEDTPDNRKRRMELLLGLAEALDLLGEWDGVVDVYGKLLPLTEEFGDKRMMATVYRHLGEIRHKRNEWDEALKYLNAALNLAGELGDQTGRADALRGTAKVLWRMGRWDEAKANLEESIRIAEGLGEMEVVAKAAVDLGNIHREKGDLKEAVACFQRGLAIAEQLGDMDEMVRGYNNLGTVYYDEGDIPKAIEYFEKCRAAAAKAGFMQNMAYGLANAGGAYARVGEYGKAEEYLTRALELFETLGERLVIADIHSSFGILYRGRKEWQRSEESFRKSAALFEEIGASYYQSDVQYEMGVLFSLMGRKEDANSSFWSALKTAEKLGNQRIVEKVKEALGG